MVGCLFFLWLLCQSVYDSLVSSGIVIIHLNNRSSFHNTTTANSFSVKIKIPSLLKLKQSGVLCKCYCLKQV